MFGNFWHDWLYQPLFNFLIWIYNNYTEQNLGWAVVYLTIVLRLGLLPFTIVTERGRAKKQAVFDEVERIEREYRKDSILQKQEIRRALKKKRIYPWAKFITLGVQALVFILLYQVFLRGITGEKILRILYPAVDFPGKINTYFFGFDLAARHDVYWAGIVAIWLALEIYIIFLGRKATRSDLLYFIVFPFFVFLALWWLPMVKSVFILTSMLFSVIVHQFMKLFFRPQKITAR